jgi:hypothetical protein
MTVIRWNPKRLARALVVGSLPLVVACGPALGQPNMESALNALISARGSLERAAHNKGGHRVRALELTNAAINEVQMGIQVGAH